MADKASFLGAYSPWSTRSNTPNPKDSNPETNRSKDDSDVTQASTRANQDPSTLRRYQLSSRDYPKDCPKARTRWFYATDSPKRKAQYSNVNYEKEEPLPKPKKYSAFSSRDSWAIEKAYQDVVERQAPKDQSNAAGHQRSKSLADASDKEPGDVKDADDSSASESVKVPVNEDYLFDVDIQKRELGPAYWLGPVYEVRRGLWFYQDGANRRPCDENLAGQLEQGYLKIKPWQLASASAGDSSPPSTDVSEITDKDGSKTEEPPKSPLKDAKDVQVTSKNFELQTQRLFGQYMNSVVTYTDPTTAWLLTDDILSRMSSTVYQRFAGGGHLGGTKVVRGFVENQTANKDTKDAKKENSSTKEKTSNASDGEITGTDASESQEPPTLQKLKRQMSSLNPMEKEAEAQQQDEKEIKEDYQQAEGEDQGREIEHLVLVTHGIGQKLGLRLEMLNFIADVNTLRKTLKAVYGASADLQLLNSEVQDPKNCRIQVLPVVWRHQLNFPNQSFKENKEQDMTDKDEEEEYPSLENITLEPPTIIRTAIRDLGLDILMYQSAYREHISETVVSESNRVYKSFKERNPNFAGKVSLIGHSLGSAIMFDVLCHQKFPSMSRARTSSSAKSPNKTRASLQLDFEVEDYYCFGSPLGLYQMLNGRRIAGRRAASEDTKAKSTSAIDDPFLGASSTENIAPVDPEAFSISNSSPKCAQLFNIFHPADPIAYRLEPLVSTAMASLKPQPLPYTKKGIFDVQGQGLSAIGNRVGQSVSGLWSSVTGGMAASLLNRTLGMPADTAAKASANSVIQPRPSGKEGDEDFQIPPTLIDDEIETLYSGFEKSRRIKQSDESRDLGESSQWTEIERRSQKLKREEAKVRALNSNGRIDYAIQTGVFDMTNPMASIASHLAYWNDEDVSHFMISQLLSRQRIVKKDAGK